MHKHYLEMLPLFAALLAIIGEAKHLKRLTTALIPRQFRVVRTHLPTAGMGRGTGFLGVHFFFVKGAHDTLVKISSFFAFAV